MNETPKYLHKRSILIGVDSWKKAKRGGYSIRLYKFFYFHNSKVFRFEVKESVETYITTVRKKVKNTKLESWLKLSSQRNQVTRIPKHVLMWGDFFNSNRNSYKNISFFEKEVRKYKSSTPRHLIWPFSVWLSSFFQINVHMISNVLFIELFTNLQIYRKNHFFPSFCFLQGYSSCLPKNILVYLYYFKYHDEQVRSDF